MRRDPGGDATLVAMYHPANIRRGLFTASERTSKYGRSLVRNGRILYNTPIIHRMPRQTANGVETRVNASTTPAAMRASHSAYASGMETRPDGTGRSLFV